MGNEVAKSNPFGGSISLKDKEAMAKRAAESAETGARGGAPDGSDYMNFSGKRGMYTIGQDKRRVESDELWLLNITSFEDGYVCWKGGKPAAQRMANIFGAGHPVTPPSADEGGPFDESRGEGWFKAKAWVAKSLDHDQQGYFKNNSVSGVGEMADMIKEVAQRMGTGQPAWPVFSYDMEEFESQGYKNFKPVMKIYGWLDDEAVGALGENPDADIDDLIAKSAVSGMLPEVKADDSEDTADKRSDPASEPQQAAEGGRRRRRRSA